MNHIKIDKLKVKKAGNSEQRNLLMKLMNYNISFSSGKLGNYVREQFYYELSILLESGVDLKSALELVVSGQKKEMNKDLFEKLKIEIINGKSLSDAMELSGKFSTYEFFSIQIGEESGNLVFVLKQLAQYFKSRISQRRQIISAATYPIVVLSTAFIAILFMLKFVVPMFADIFSRNGNELPALTLVILKLSNFISSYFWFFIILCSCIVIFLRTKLHTIWFRKYSTYFLSRIPVIGSVVSNIYLARFSFSLSLLFSAKIPLLKALQLTAKMVDYYPIEQALLSMEQNVMNGVSLHKCMSEYKIFPKRMIALVKAGEEVNTLDVFFNTLGEHFTQDVNHKASILSSLLEPVIIIFLGLMVGVILIAMYLPLFKMGSML